MAEAIWFKKPVYSEEPCDYRKQIDDIEEIVDEFDDAAEIERKSEFNKNLKKLLMEPRDPYYREPIELSNDQHAEQHKQFNEIFDLLISIGCDYRVFNHYGENLINAAALRNNLPILKKLIELGVDPNMPGEYRNRPIHFVKRVEFYRELIKHLPKDVLSICNADGETPLHTFARANDSTDATLLREMLANGADLHARDNNGNTPLHGVNDVEFAKIMLENGANINAQNNNGETPTHLVFSEDKYDHLKVFFSNENLNLNLITKKGVSLLPGLVQLNDKDFNEILPELEKRPDELDRLFQEHCNSVSAFGIPVLHMAIRPASNKYCLEKLLRTKTIDLNKYGFVTTVSLARPELLQRLIDMGAKFNAPPNVNLITPLMLAVGNRNVQMASRVESVRVLLRNGAEVNSKDQYGQTALQSAIKLGDCKEGVVIAAALIAANAGYTNLNDGYIDKLKPTFFKCLFEYDD